MYIDYKETRSLFTPITLIALPIVILTLYIESIGSIRGYFNITIDVYIFLLLNFIFIWLPGQIFFLTPLGKLKINKEFEHIKDFIQKHFIILLVLLWTSIIAGLLNLFSFIHQYGITFIAKENFKGIYGGGILGHLVNLGYPSFILLAAYMPPGVNKKIVLSSLFLMAFVIFVSQVKYHLIIPIITIFILRSLITKKKAIVYKNLVFGGVLIFLVFFLTYFFVFTIAYGYDEALSSTNFILNHLGHYLLSGPIALGQYLAHYNQIFNLEDLLNVPINIYRWISGLKEYNVSLWTQPWVQISKSDTTNVGTMFGTVYLALGYWGTLFFSLILGIISYAIYYVTMKTKKISWILFNSWLLGTLSVSFFGYHFHLLLIWEVAFYSLITPFLYSILNKIFLQNKKLVFKRYTTLNRNLLGNKDVFKS
jgi:oligosaccharide repeat unit polymerase